MVDDSDIPADPKMGTIQIRAYRENEVEYQVEPSNRRRNVDKQPWTSKNAVTRRKRAPRRDAAARKLSHSG